MRSRVLLLLSSIPLLAFCASGGANRSTGVAGVSPSDRQVLLVVLDHLKVDEKGDARMAQIPVIYDLTVGPPKGELPVARELDRSLRSRNAEPLSLAGLRLVDPGILISSETADKLFEGDPERAWRSFHDIFPDASGLMKVSLPGYDAAQTEAAVYYIVASSPLAEEGHLVLLKKAATGWAIEWDKQLWTS